MTANPGTGSRPLAVGIQLYSVRNALRTDPYGTLERLATLGFTRIEAANHSADTDDGIGLGVPAAELAATLSGLGLSVVGSHINPLDLDRLPAVLDYHEALGNRQIGCDIEFYPPGDLDYVLRRAELFNRVGELCAERGMRFYYHNHFQEFQLVNGATVYETVLDHTDPSLVFIEMDTYWMYRGGQDPIEWMTRYADRVILLHQKDFPADAPQPLNLFDGVVDRDQAITFEVFMAVKNPLCFVEIGTGVLPIQDIVDTAARLPRFETLLLEQDHTRLDELESVAVSRQALAALQGIDWS